MQDRPTANELIEAVREFLKSEILSSVDDPRTRFRTLVAMNALGILGREIALEENLLAKEYDLLSRLLEQDPKIPESREELVEHVGSLNRELADLIRSGGAPPETLGILKETIRDKLAVASPRYLERYAEES